MKKNYNYTRRKLYLPEYGRHIHEMVDRLLTIEDREERNRQARAVIAVMGNLNPLLRDTADFTHKLWDHLFIMSDFQLDVDSPYPRPTRQELTVAPHRMAYSQGRIAYKHYGKYTERMIRSLSAHKDPHTVARTVDNIARYMRAKSYEYNQEHPNNETIIKDIKRMSEGAIQIDEVALNNLRSDYKQHHSARPQRGPMRQQQRSQHNRNQQHNRNFQKTTDPIAILRSKFPLFRRKKYFCFLLFNIVPMKKSTVLFTLVAALFLCGCRSSKVKISGRFVGNEAKTVYLEQVTPLAQSVIDSTLLDAQGNYRFLLKTAPQSPALYNIVYNGERIPLFLAAGDRVEVGSVGNVVRNYTVAGSEESELLRRFYQAFVTVPRTSTNWHNVFRKPA